MQRKRYHNFYLLKFSEIHITIHISNMRINFSISMFNFLVKCFKQNLARPRSDQDACESMAPWVEECQRRCEDKFETDEQGNSKRCVEFTLYNKTDDYGTIEGECCLYMTPSSTYEHKAEAISGPPRCGM